MPIMVSNSVGWQYVIKIHTNKIGILGKNNKLYRLSVKYLVGSIISCIACLPSKTAVMISVVFRNCV